MKILRFTCTLLLYVYTIAGANNGKKYSNVTCKYINPITIPGCVIDSNTSALQLSIVTPLEEPLSLDILTDNILYLSILNLQAIPVNITATRDLPNLRTLTIGLEGIFSITNNSFFYYLQRIELINIYNTTFQSIPSLSHLHTLTYLSIQLSVFLHSPNTQIEEGFVGGLDQLKYLQITDSSPPISSISDLALRGLSSLTQIVLVSNNIHTMSENLLQHSHQLLSLSLKHNSITYLHFRTFQQLPFLTWIDLENNPLNCSCDLQWMSTAKYKYKFSFTNTKCKYSASYENLTATSPDLYTSCPPLPLSLQCLNKSTPLCPSPLSCYNTADSYQCSSCPPGYGQVSDSRCVDLDSCSRTPSPCGDNLCNNTVGSFYCYPPSNSCDTRNGGCEQKCEFNETSHCCTCYPGFEFSNIVGECVSTMPFWDINKCNILVGILIPICIISWLMLTIVLIISCCYFKSRRSRKYQVVIQYQDKAPLNDNIFPLACSDDLGGFGNCSISSDEC